MQSKLYKYSALFFALILWCSSQLQAQDYLPEVPKIQTSVYDNAKMMSQAESTLLEQKLIR